MDLADEVRALREDVRALTARLDGALAPAMMNTAQCAAFLGMSPDRLYEWRKERIGPPYMHLSARSILYEREAVIAWAQSHKIEH
ncbi:DNA-binding protein [Palleronia sediminis]|uniref:DNA-binding protein n=1 Tax=Palleronia sediminis TaxID=2547833 RepID=A0A4R6A3E6_9RHOB|nr:helix-turn-helix domain-containing protein [Palleronia sediminis]TDL78110.1 DNA-binding protein [Palleronia sediminis]